MKNFKSGFAVALGGLAASALVEIIAAGIKAVVKPAEQKKQTKAPNKAETKMEMSQALKDCRNSKAQREAMH